MSVFKFYFVELMYSASRWAKPKGLFLEYSIGYQELRRLKLKYTRQFTLCLLQIIDGRLPTGSTNQVSIKTVVEVASGKGHNLKKNVLILHAFAC